MEDLFYQRMLESQILNEKLAIYNGKPAIFQRAAPEDSDTLWGEKKYPRILYEISVHSNPEIDMEGKLIFRIYEDSKQSSGIKEIQNELTELFHYCFFPNRTMEIGTKWLRTKMLKPLVQENIQGYMIIFQLMGCCNQEIGGTDVVQAMNHWLLQLNGKIRIPGRNILKNIWKASKENPAVYCRIENFFPGIYDDTWKTTWITVRLCIHVIGDKNVRLKMIRKICEQLALEDKLFMQDGGTFFIESIRERECADSFQKGQIMVRGQYGVEKEENQALKIQKVNIKEEKK